MYMTVKETAKYLNIKEKTLYYWAKIGWIPCHRFSPSGRCIQFKKEEIDFWVEKRYSNAGESLRSLRKGR